MTNASDPATDILTPMAPLSFSIRRFRPERSMVRLAAFTGLRLFNAAAGLVIHILVVQQLTVREFGIFAMVLTLLGFMTTFGFSWSSSALTYFGAAERLETGTMQKTFWARSMVAALSLSLVLLLFVTIEERIKTHVGLSASTLLLAWLLVKIVLDTLMNYFLAVKQQAASALVITTGKLAFLGILVCCRLSLVQLIAVNAACDAVGILLSLGMKKSDIGPPILDQKALKTVLNFGLWQLFGFSGLYLINFGDNIIISHYLSLEDVAVYNGAYKLFNSIAGLSYIFSSYFAPTAVEAVSQNNREKIRQLFYRDRFLVIALVTVPHLLFMACSGDLTQLLYGGRYDGSGPLLAILMAGSLIRFATVFNILVFNTTRKYGLLQGINLVRAVLNILLDILFIQWLGLAGAAWATLAALAITALASTVYCEIKLQHLTSAP